MIFITNLNNASYNITVQLYHISVCTHMVNHTRKGLVYYTGNYDSFVNTREEKEGEQEKRFRLEQDQIKHMKDYVAKFGQGNAKMARQAQSKEKILDKMLKSGLTDKVEHEKALDFKFPDCGKISPPVLQCNDIAFGYPGCEILYAGVDFGIDLDSRVALVGPNGAGDFHTKFNIYHEISCIYLIILDFTNAIIWFS
jgi:ATP-binding cassette, subfamily F, member 2